MGFISGLYSKLRFSFGASAAAENSGFGIVMPLDSVASNDSHIHFARTHQATVVRNSQIVTAAILPSKS